MTYLPEFTGGYKDSVTIRQLLEHRSGLPADRDCECATALANARFEVE